MAAEFNYHDDEDQLKVAGRDYAQRCDEGAGADEKRGVLDQKQEDTDEQALSSTSSCESQMFDTTY